MSGSAMTSEELPAVDAAAGFTRFVWITLAYTVGVILFGAWVRVSGSGAGCGQHWPTCNGQVVPLPHNVHMAIELTHRLTSGLDFVLVVAVTVRAFARFERGSLVRKTAALAGVFILGEVLIGAAIVLLRLVGHDSSVARATVMAAHLVNTCFLTGSLALAAWGAGDAGRRLRGKLGWGMVVALFGTLLVATLGAVTALGDTLFPVRTSQPLEARLAADHTATANFLERLRIAHPLGAVLVAALVLYLATALPERHPDRDVKRWARAVGALVVLQLIAGVVNIALSAPGWMQLTHLGLAMLLWIALVLLGAATLSSERPLPAAV
jgi:heme a synthase